MGKRDSDDVLARHLVHDITIHDVEDFHVVVIATAREPVCGARREGGGVDVRAVIELEVAPCFAMQDRFASSGAE